MFVIKLDNLECRKKGTMDMFINICCQTGTDIVTADNEHLLSLGEKMMKLQLKNEQKIKNISKIYNLQYV